MKTCTKCKEDKDFVEFSKDKTHKDGLCSQCKNCKAKYVAGYYQENREEIIENVRNYSIENAESISIRNSKHYIENKDIIITKVKKHREKTKKINLEKRSLGIEPINTPKECYNCNSIKDSNEFYKDISRVNDISNLCKGCSKIHIGVWAKENPDKCNKNSAKWRSKNLDKRRSTQNKRNSEKIKRTPFWLTKEQHEEIGEFYSLAKELQWLSEDKLEVDHIVPLQGKNVSGLHVPWNLQILPKSMNASKGNRF